MRRVSGPVENDLSWKNLVAEQRRDGIGNLGRSRIITIDHQRFERDGVRERLPGRALVECRLCTEGVAIELTHGSLLLFCSVYTRYGSISWWTLPIDP